MSSVVGRHGVDRVAAPTCPSCGQGLEVLTLELPLGLGRRSWPVECPCESRRRDRELRQRRIEEHRALSRCLLGRTGIGARHSAATFETFEVTPGNRRILDVCRAYVEAFPERGKGLTLAGPPGTGKTHLVVALTRALTERGVSAVIVNVPQLLLTFRSRLHGEGPSRIDETLEFLTRCEHLVLDDLGRERQTAWAQETLYLVINARYEECLATSITTDLGAKRLRARVGAPILDRLDETNAIYWCQWPSHRHCRREPSPMPALTPSGLTVDREASLGREAGAPTDSGCIETISTLASSEIQPRRERR